MSGRLVSVPRAGIPVRLPRAFGRCGLVALLAIAAWVVVPGLAAAQSTAMNGTIEGIIVDSSGAVLPGVTITVTNTDNGAQRVVVTNERGIYRASLLPLGRYDLVAEISGFKKIEQKGVTLVAGQTAVMNLTLTVGGVTETISVTAEAPVVDVARIDLGRNLTTLEIKNLPLVSRNPYNFALLQAGVTGYENTEFGIPRFSANGSLLRIDYQIDGNTNTQKDRAGLRLVPMSEVMIQEVKIVTSGYAPEFGQTTGMVYNAITPSGTNTVKGSASFRLRRKPWSGYPFFFTGVKNEANRPDTKINSYTGELGGPIVKDKLHYFFGYENTYRDLSQQRVIRTDPAVVAAVGLPAQPAFVPFHQTGTFYIPKLDYTINQSNRLTWRWVRFHNDQPGNAGGGYSVLDTTNDYLDVMNSTAVQLVSTLGSTKLNEFRVQYANRHTSYLLSQYSGTEERVSIPNVITFGRPWDSPADFKQGILQVIDNFSWVRGDHMLKVGFSSQTVFDHRATALSSSYTFPTLQAYLDAASGKKPYGYTRFSQTLGNPYFDMTSKIYGVFAQDDWRLSPNLKVLYGVRYDVNVYPPARADSPFSFSQHFNIDKNNIAPRLGFAWNLGKGGRTVVRASTSIMYDQAMLGAYTSAIESNGSPVRISIGLAPGATGAPAYPNTLTDAYLAGYALPLQNIFTIDPNRVDAHTFQNNVQVERGLGKLYSVSVGLIYSKGYNLPVVNNINLINPTGYLADGRPIFSTATNASTRMDPRFNAISVVQSVGVSNYRAVTLQFGRRSRSLQFDLSYSYGRGRDNAPASGTLSFLGDAAPSDPTNLNRDWGPNLLDIRHNFSGSVVASPEVRLDNVFLKGLLNNNQVALMLQFNSGLPYSVTTNQDLNQDGNSNDRALFYGRNSNSLPNRWNVDMRYSRYVPIHNNMRLEIMAEFKNVFNTVQVSGIVSQVATDKLGNPLAPIPTYVSSYSNPGGFVPTNGFEQREFQLGFKFHF